MNLQPLTRPQGPWLHLLVASPSDACDAVGGLERDAPLRLVARVIRGRKAKTVAAFFDECAAALQFPYYFGENWDAFHDCLTDLRWLRAEALVLCFVDADQLLDKATAEQVENFAKVIEEAVRHWNQPAQPRTPTPFHVVFHDPPGGEAIRKRWQAAGLNLNPLI
jgi:RNAse (barnase) inhibitor barstar